METVGALEGTRLSVFTSDGTPLNPQCTDEAHAINEFVANLAAVPCVEVDILNRDVMPPGRYEPTGGQFPELHKYTIDVYPGGAIYVHLGMISSGSIGDPTILVGPTRGSPTIWFYNYLASDRVRFILTKEAVRVTIHQGYYDDVYKWAYIADRR